VQYGIPRFEFRQVAAAHTLSQLTAAGVSIAKLRQSLDQLRRWLPDVTQALQQLDVLEGTGSLLVRLEAGELAEPDGQLHMDYDAQAATATAAHEAVQQDPGAQLRLVVGPASPADWHAQGIDQERHGLLGDAEASSSYRRALLDGGADPAICFDLATVLQSQGKLPAAAERYRQTLELDPKHIEAWNNLGVVLGELGQADEACTAFQRALRLDAMCAMSHWNLADTLEAMGMSQAARQHWEAYLKLEPADGVWALHARKRLSGK
jgi:tetratricopeptide (TPR) repeat protein